MHNKIYIYIYIYMMNMRMYTKQYISIQQYKHYQRSLHCAATQCERLSN